MSAPPPVNSAQRPVRRRNGPAWASVHVIKENEEKGPHESTVRCRFCLAEFQADTARITMHVTLLTSSQDLPLCYADATPTSPEDRAVAVQWISDHDQLQFFNKLGMPAVLNDHVRSSIRACEQATSVAVLYPGDARSRVAASAASEAVRVVTEAAVAELKSPEAAAALVRVGCGLGDTDCLRVVDLIKRAGPLPKLRALSFAENAIGDDGFTAICQELLAPNAQDPDHGAGYDGGYGGYQESGGRKAQATSPPDSSSATLAQAGSAAPPPAASADDADDEPPPPGMMGNLAELSFFRNPIGDRGLAALAEILCNGALPMLESLNMSGTALVNPDGSPRLNMDARQAVAAGRLRQGEQEEGVHRRHRNPQRTPRNGDVSSRRRSTSSTQLPSTPMAAAAQNPDEDAAGESIGDVGLKALAVALSRNRPRPGQPGMLTNLRDLRLFGNRISDDGMIALADALSVRPMLTRNLEELWLQSNEIGDRGLCHTVELLFNGAMVKLRRLLLSDNRIGSEGVASLGAALSRGALAKLRKLSLGGNPIDDAAVDHLGACLVDRTYSLGGSIVVETDVLPTVG
jgi:hypothetical protein